MFKGEINRTGFAIGIQVEQILLEKKGESLQKMVWIQIIQIIVLLNLIQSPQSFVLDPICQSCISIDSSLVSKYYNQSLKTNLTLFQLPGFSLSTIIVDFRHLKQFPEHNNETIFQLIFEITDISSQSKTIQLINDTIIGTNIYELETTAEQSLKIFFFVQNEYKQFEYLLRDSISLNLSYSNNRIPTQDSSFVFVVSSQDEISLPSNKPDLTNINNFYLENEHNTSSFVTTTASSESTTYWGTESQFAVPYFPYFANCNGEGNMMHIMQMLQNQTDCSLVPINETQSINEFSFGSSAKGDKCLIKRKCTIEGSVQKSEYPDWMTLTSNLNLFAISQQKVNWRDFSYDMSFEDEDLVQCKINSSMGSNSSQSYPLKVKLSMGYYQFSQTGKKIISCLVEYDLYVQSSSNFTYQLQIAAYPLNHTYILLNFGFKWYVYMIVFLIIGLIGNIENLLLWIYHYFVADQKKEIKIMMYFTIIKEIIKGTIMALLLELIILIVVCVIMNGKIFTTTFYTVSDTGSTMPHMLFDYILQTPIKNYDSEDMQKLRSGRMGLGFVTIGVMILLLYSKHFVGKEKPKEEYKDFQILGRIFKPIDWNRGKFLFGTFIYIIIQYFFIYFAYSSLYSENIWTFIVVVKVVQIIMQEITKSIYDDILPGLPLKIVTDITAFMNTISAADLYDFLFGSLIDVAVTMIEKIYIFQIQNAVVEKIIEKGEEFNKFYINLINEEDGEEEGKQKLLGSEECGMGQMDENENQEVFISREAQQVEFIEEQVKEISIFTRPQQQAILIAECKESQQEKKLKQRYFQSLKRQSKHQRQLLPTTIKKPKQQRHKTSQQQGQIVDQQQRQQQLQKQSAIFQLLLDHMAMIYTFILQPFVVFLFWLTYDQSQILSNYGIVYNTVILYLLSSLVIGALSVINIIIIFHILENYMGYSFEEQVTDILERFSLRDTFWIAEQHRLNSNLKEDMLGADHYCLSSQLFFILTVYVGGMEFVILGLAIIFQTNYNFFDDVATIPIIIFWIGFLLIFIQIVIKIATIINLWDYKKYHTQTQTQQNLYGIMDQKQLMIHMQQNSDFKTENIIFAPLEEIPNYKKLFKQKTPLQDEKEQRSSYIQALSQDAKSFQKIKKNQLHHKNLRLSNSEQKDQIILAQKRLQTICKKLQPLFVKEFFKLQYTKRNQDFIKENIEKILPLVDYLPDLSEYRGMLAPTENNQSRIGSVVRQKQTTKVKGQQTSNKNMDPVVAEMILEWLRVTEKERQKRIINGIQLESQSKKCSFCFETWALYYGHDGMCLNCSMRLSKLNKQKESFNQKLVMNLSKESLLSQNQSNLRRGKKKKSTKKKNRLNVITEEEDIQDENSMTQDDESDEEIMKSIKKEHHE